jgi:hypothetical protein
VVLLIAKSIESRSGCGGWWASRKVKVGLFRSRARRFSSVAAVAGLFLPSSSPQGKDRAGDVVVARGRVCLFARP